MTSQKRIPILTDNFRPQRLFRRWFRFSLRTLLLLFVVVALLLHFWIIPSERQRRACEKIKATEGYYWFDENLIQDDQLLEFLFKLVVNDEKPQNWYAHYFNNVHGVSVDRVDHSIDWHDLPKLKGLLLIDCLDPNSILQDKSLIQSVRQILLAGNFDKNTIDVLSQYENLETFVIYTNVSELTDEELLRFTQFPKLRKLRIKRPSSCKFILFDERNRLQSLYEKMKLKIGDIRIEFASTKAKENKVEWESIP